ncbi:hypothetical protein Ddye_009080 [Dipteronia dyeriana]|uniref:Uncharacterized protein n=1 Tax=Dipteronia dyeriana TaxID=168575 RepID=A0AAD9XAY0_9ROSI|nr:hypothetical protein Ddye_009080 [Dipteronia dyeriana]
MSLTLAAMARVPVFRCSKEIARSQGVVQETSELRKRGTRYDIFKRIDASYYGYRDEEDGVLEKVEGPAQGANSG